MAAKKKRDTDYLAISSRIRVLENRLLTRERMEQLVEAREDGEVLKVLADCGYPEPISLSPVHVEQALTKAQADLFAELDQALGEDNGVLPVFQVKYDYHNAKALIKAEAVGADPDRLLVAGGRYDPQALADRFRRDELGDYAPAFRTAVAQARALLADSHDPQRADFLLDRACCAELTEQAEAAGPFLAGYVRIHIDALNLRACVRAERAGRGAAFLREALIPGGSVDTERIAAAKPDDLPALFGDAGLKAAAALGVPLAAGSGGDMTAFERACDDAVGAYIRRARRVPFGVEPVVGYLYARQAELVAVRTILSGRMAHLDKDVIRERLREAYV